MNKISKWIMIVIKNNFLKINQFFLNDKINLGMLYLRVNKSVIKLESEVTKKKTNPIVAGKLQDVKLNVIETRN